LNYHRVLVTGGAGFIGSHLLDALISDGCEVCVLLQIYVIDRQITTNIALASIAFILIGLFAVFTAITLYVISRLMRKTNRR
jgi:nucleoside-diphosphate-sugar epimerase